MIDTTLEQTAQTSALANAPAVLHEATPQMPSYMTEVYDWAYVDPAWVRWLDHNLVVRTLLFGNDQRLMRRYLAKVKPGMRVWQVAHVYGDLVEKVAHKVGDQGTFHLTDVTPIQVNHGLRKVGKLPWSTVIRQDAAEFTGDAPYDLVCSFFLLHEVPDDWKTRIIDNMLSRMKDDGEVLFVDYHRPSRLQPIRYILKWVNRVLEPFAEALWDHDISHFASHAENYTWEKRTIFGGVYQIVSVRKKTAK